MESNMAQRFLGQVAQFDGVIKQLGNVSEDSHVITRGYLHQNVINAIHPDSANYLEVLADGGVNKLKVKPLTVTNVTVDSTQSSLANFIANVYDGGNFQEGDIVFLTQTSPVESYIHNGGNAGTAADWELVNSGLSDAQVRAKLSASSGINYNSATGEFTADQAEIQAFFSAGTGLSYSAGQFVLDATSDQITEGVNNLFYKDQLVDDHLSGGTAISYAAGVISFVGTTDDVTEGTNKYYANGLVDAHLSGGTAISYAAGVISFVGTTDDVTEGSNKYYSSAAVYGDIGVTVVAGPDVQLLSYDGAGKFSVKLSDVFTEFSAGQGLSWDGAGQFALDAVTDDIAEGAGAVNLWFTQARARDSVSADPAFGNLLTYDSATGKLAVMTSKIRKSFANQTLTANTGLNLVHNLGERLVHVSAMDSTGAKIELEVIYTNQTTVQVKSTVNLTGVDFAVSL
jgi:hypothetical protein